MRASGYLTGYQHANCMVMLSIHKPTVQKPSSNEHVPYLSRSLPWEQAISLHLGVLWVLMAASLMQNLVVLHLPSQLLRQPVLWWS